MTTTPVNLLDFDLDGLTAYCEGLGEKRFRATQLFRWVHQRGVADFSQMTDLAKSFRDKLAGVAEVRALPVITQHDSRDGTIKWLFDVGGGNAVEAVFIPEDDRGTLCISSQAGCAVGCRFCSTGHQGFSRNLSTAEIVGQLWFAEHFLRRHLKTDEVRYILQDCGARAVFCSARTLQEVDAGALEALPALPLTDILPLMCPYSGTMCTGRPRSAGAKPSSVEKSLPASSGNWKRPLPRRALYLLSFSNPKGEKPQLPVTCVVMPCRKNGMKNRALSLRAANQSLWECASMNPGATHLPCTSITRSASRASTAPMAAMQPPSISRFAL